MSLRPLDLTERHNNALMVLISYETPHPPAAIEQYPCVAFPRPFELGAGSKLFVVGHGTPRSPKLECERFRHLVVKSTFGIIREFSRSK
jgi:hypothetical protein